MIYPLFITVIVDVAGHPVAPVSIAYAPVFGVPTTTPLLTTTSAEALLVVFHPSGAAPITARMS
jgi:hypothetical protein